MAKVPNALYVEQYQLKSTFFIEGLQSYGFFELYETMSALAEANNAAYGWADRKSWSISEEAWDRVRKAGLNPILVFVHPKLLNIHPHHLRYYRCIAMLPLKGLASVSGWTGADKVERGKGRIPDAKIAGVVSILNETISLLINMASKLDGGRLAGMMFATAGTQLDGSFRNRIGAEGGACRSNADH